MTFSLTFLPAKGAERENKNKNKNKIKSIKSKDSSCSLENVPKLFKSLAWIEKKYLKSLLISTSKYTIQYYFPSELKWNLHNKGLIDRGGDV